jgi:hypothetical protein
VKPQISQAAPVKAFAFGAHIALCGPQDFPEDRMGFLTRWLFAFALVAVTFNPTDFNYLQWVRAHGAQNLSVAVLVGLLLSVGYIIYLRATLRSIGVGGMLLVMALLGALIWVLYDFGLLRLGNDGLTVWLGVFALSVVLGVGLSWSHIRRALAGQSDVDDVDE